MPALSKVAPRTLSLPPSGSKAIFCGDSISDPLIGTSNNGFKYAAKLCNTFGWRALGGNMCPNPSFETDASSWVGAQATLTADATHGGSTVTTGAGAKALKIVPTVNGGAASAAPEGDIGALRLGLQPGVTYTFSADVFVPTGTTGSWFISIWDSTDGTTFPDTAVAITPANSWQRVSVTRTIQAGAVQAFCRLQNTTASTAQPVWMDAVQVEPGSVANAWFNTSGTVAKPAMTGTLLQSTDATANNWQASIATRFTPFVAGGVDIISLFFGTNDLNQVTSTANKTRVTWRAALDAALQACALAAPQAQVVLLGLPGGNIQLSAATAVSQWGSGWTQGMAGNDTNNITQQAAREYGACFCDLAGVTTMMGDGLHPAQAGHDVIVTAFKRCFGQ